jgi:CRP-like cAMP-binding protein
MTGTHDKNDRSLRQHIISRLGNDIDNLDTVLSYFKPVQIDRNKFLVQQGQICKKIYFVAKGCLQVFVYDNDMNETTRDIVTEGTWCSELLSFGAETRLPKISEQLNVANCFLLTNKAFRNDGNRTAI